MAFVDPLDPDTPADTDLVSEGDDEIRSLKRALNERLSVVFNNWPDGDEGDMDITIKREKLDSSVSVIVGDFVDRPAADAEGDLFYAADAQVLYISYESDPGVFEWRVSRALVRFGTDFPHEIADAPDGLLFYNTETKVLYMAVVGTGWVAIYNGSTTSGIVTAASWADAAAAGTKVQNPVAARKLIVKGGGTAVAGVFAMPLSEFAAFFSFTNFRSVVGSARYGSGSEPLIVYASASLTDIELYCITDEGTIFDGAITFTAEITYV